MLDVRHQAFQWLDVCHQAFRFRTITMDYGVIGYSIRIAIEKLSWNDKNQIFYDNLTTYLIGDERTIKDLNHYFDIHFNDSLRIYKFVFDGFVFVGLGGRN